VVTALDKIEVWAGSIQGKEGGLRLMVKSVHIHTGYQSTADPKEHDLTILELAPPGVVYDGSNLVPLCLPTESVKDLGTKVLAAGWGHERTDTTCLTNQRGPVQFTECATQKSKSEEGGGGGGEGGDYPPAAEAVSALSSPCERTSPPPTTPTCAAFMSKIRRRTDIDIYRVMPAGESCYAPAADKAKDGWCYTTQVS
jgi:hypothetical protein